MNRPRSIITAAMISTIMLSHTPIAAADELGWISAGRQNLDDAYDELRRVGDDAEESENGRRIAAALELHGAITLAKSYFEHVVTIDQLRDVSKYINDPLIKAGTQAGAAYRCIDLSIGAKRLNAEITRQNKQGVYKGYGNALPPLVNTLQTVIERCENIQKVQAQLE